MQAGCVFQSAVTAWNASHAALLQRTRWFTFHQYNIRLLVHGHAGKPMPTQCYIAIIIIIHNIYIMSHHAIMWHPHSHIRACINTYMYTYMCRTHSGFPSTMWWTATVRLRSNRTQQHLNTNMCMQESLYMYSWTCTSTPLPPLSPLYNWCCYNVVCVYVYNSCTCKLRSAYYDCHPCTCNIVCITLMNLKSLSVIFLARLAGSSTGMVPVLTGAGMDGECSNKPFSWELVEPTDRLLLCSEREREREREGWKTASIHKW